MNTIIRNFTTMRGDKEINYPFTTFPEILGEGRPEGNAGKLFDYLKDVFINGIPDNSVPSISEMNELFVDIVREENNITTLASLAEYEGQKFNQHNIIQEFLLKEDPLTIATEIPVWTDEMQGHIDIIRILENDIIQVLDFKPLAHKERKAPSQVWRYRKALSKRTGIPAKNIQAGYFDNKNSYFLI